MSKTIALQPGVEVVPGYVIERELGRGGMGVVLLVKNVNTSEYFAVKTAISSNARTNRLFLKEVAQWHELAAHPHLVQCYFSQKVDSRVFVFAEYVDSGSIEQWIRSGVLIKLRDKLDIAIQLAHAIQALHDQHLIHQDVKPQNVLVNSQGLVKLTDFGLAGIAHRVATDDGIDESVTVNGMTLPYRSPEQAALKRVDGRTDQWSWAMTVLAMFAGGLTWQYGEQGEGILSNFLGNLSRVSMLMPLEMWPILRRSLELDPTKRWPSMAVVASEFERLYLRRIGTAHKIGELADTGREFRSIIAEPEKNVPKEGSPRDAKGLPQDKRELRPPIEDVNPRMNLEAEWERSHSPAAFHALLKLYEQKAQWHTSRGDKQRAIRYFERGARLLGERGIRLIGSPSACLTVGEQEKLFEFHRCCGVLHADLGDGAAGLQALDRAYLAIRVLNERLASSPRSERKRVDVLELRLAATRAYLLQKSGQTSQAFDVVNKAAMKVECRCEELTEGIRDELARLWYCAGTIHDSLGSRDEASRAFGRAVNYLEMTGLKRSLDAQYLLFKLLNRQALFAYDARNFERAMVLFQEQRNLLEKDILPQSTGLGRVGLAKVFVELGKLVENHYGVASAIEWYERSITACKSAVNEHGFKRYEERLAYALEKEAKAKKRLAQGKGRPARGANFPLLDDWDFRKISFGQQ